MSTILEEVKVSRGVEINNLGFDQELLMYINSAASKLVQLGVSEFEDLLVEESSAWPTFRNQTLESLSKHYVSVIVGQTFDPSASPVISESLHSHVGELEGRITHEVEEIEANVI